MQTISENQDCLLRQQKFAEHHSIYRNNTVLYESFWLQWYYDPLGYVLRSDEIFYIALQVGCMTIKCTPNNQVFLSKELHKLTYLSHSCLLVYWEDITPITR